MQRYTAATTRVTPQSEAIPGSTQTPNNAGGFAWAVDCWTQLDRFLVLGSDAPTYYVSQRKLTQDNARSVAECIATDGQRVVTRIVEISEAGRAPKNDPALFALAMAASADDARTRSAALTALPRVARTGTHLLHFAEYAKSLRGWGRGLRDAVGQWYSAQAPLDLAYQITKYASRDGWTHRDLLRLCHVKVADESLNTVLRYVVKQDGVALDGASGDAVDYLRAVRALQGATPTGAAALVAEHRLPREVVPTELLTEPAVWAALLAHMPMTAMVRNLATMTRLGVLAPMSDGMRRVVGELAHEDRVRKARVHPLAVLGALATYGAGHGMRGGNTWSPVAQIIDALDGAFYLAFGNVPSTGKRTMLALDISGSMGNTSILGMDFLTCRVGSAAMALVTAAREPNHAVVGFSTDLVPLAISPRQRLDDAVRVVSALPFGRTDCAQPMLYALDQAMEIDTFVIYTDSETWAGGIHPAQALRRYREKTGIAAKLIVVGMAANRFSIADPADPGMLDVVGFDASAPAVMAQFAE